MEFDLENPLTSSEEDDTDPVLFLVESDQMTPTIFLECLETNDFLVSCRREAISVTSQARYFGNLDQSVSYLAVNYIDRFISTRKYVPLGNPWIRRLLIMTCVSLAAKMMNAEFSVSEFQKEEGFIFDPQTIQRMELAVLGALNWRMRSITPFSFTRFFISRLELKDPPLLQVIKDRATCIIFKSQKEIKSIEFKPSIISASALLVASRELLPSRFLSLRSSILSCEYVNKENLLRCINVMQEIVEMEGCEWMMFDTVVMSTRTPSTVLDWPCAGSESETAKPEKRRIKRLRINNNQCDNERM